MTSKLQPKRWAKAALYLASLSVAALASAHFTYSDFSSMTGMNLFGSAHTEGNVLRLTDMEGGQGGYAWQATQQHVANGFDTTFEFRVTEPWPGAGADGFAFVIQNNSGTFSAGPEAAGGGIGYHETLPNSVAIEFDTYINFGWEPLTHIDWWFDGSQWNAADMVEYYAQEGFEWDHAWDWDSGNHVAIQTRGTSNNTADYNQSGVAAGFPSFKITDGQVHTARVVYDAQAHTLKMYLDGEAEPTLSGSIDLSSTLDLNNGTAWVGFTGATGGAVSEHDILSWTFNSTVYDWSGFLAPLSHKGTYQLGSTIPVKYSLTGASNGATTAKSDFKVDGQVVGGFRYDAEGDQYIHNWSTKGLSAGAHTIEVDLGDGKIRTITVNLK